MIEHQIPLQPEQVTQKTFFYCGHCGGTRLASLCFRAINYLPDSKGVERPTANEAALDKVEDRALAEGRFCYFCLDCDAFHETLLTDAQVAEALPGLVS